MIKVGLTGNFYSGYNEVGEIFEEKGIPVFDADVVLKFMINYSPKHIEKIKEKFGDDIYKLCLLDMKRFSTSKKFDDLLDILQLDLMKSYEKWRIRNYNHFYTIFKSSILFERNLDTSMNFTISVFRPKVERRYDLKTHTSMPISTIDDILNGEMDELIKNGKADFVVHNYNNYSLSSNADYVNTQVININKALMNKSGKRDDSTQIIKNILSY
jgi:dephospho-CoA kinase